MDAFIKQESQSSDFQGHSNHFRIIWRLIIFKPAHLSSSAVSCPHPLPTWHLLPFPPATAPHAGSMTQVDGLYIERPPRPSYSIAEKAMSISFPLAMVNFGGFGFAIAISQWPKTKHQLPKCQCMEFLEHQLQEQGWFWTPHRKRSVFATRPLTTPVQYLIHGDVCLWRRFSLWTTWVT